VHVSRGAVREQNLHSTPKWRPEGEVKCTVLVHENCDCGEQPDFGAAKTPFAPKKETKAQLSRARKLRRGVQWGKAPLNFRLNSVRLYDWLEAAKKCCSQLILPRAWKRSIEGCGKLVKKNSYGKHKILG